MIRKLAVGITVLALVASLAVGCSRGGTDADSSADDIQLDLNITPDPPEMGPAVIEITLRDAEGDPIEDAELEIEGNMSHARMEPVLVETTSDGAGTYVTEGFEFTMGGDWVITVTGTLADGRELRRTFDLSGVST